MLFFVVLAFLAGVIWRAKWAASIWGNAFQQRLLIIGAGWGGRALAQAVQEHELADYEIVGFLDDDLFRRKPQVLGYPSWGQSVTRSPSPTITRSMPSFPAAFRLGRSSRSLLQLSGGRFAYHSDAKPSMRRSRNGCRFSMSPMTGSCRETLPG